MAQPPGSPESFTIGGIASATTYYFAVKTIDDVGNHSLSVVSTTTP